MFRGIRLEEDMLACLLCDFAGLVGEAAKLMSNEGTPDEIQRAFAELMLKW